MCVNLRRATPAKEGRKEELHHSTNHEVPLGVLRKGVAYTGHVRGKEGALLAEEEWRTQKDFISLVRILTISAVIKSAKGGRGNRLMRP